MSHSGRIDERHTRTDGSGGCRISGETAIRDVIDQDLFAIRKNGVEFNAEVVIGVNQRDANRIETGGGSVDVELIPRISDAGVTPSEDRLGHIPGADIGVEHVRSANAKGAQTSRQLNIGEEFRSDTVGRTRQAWESDVVGEESGGTSA